MSTSKLEEALSILESTGGIPKDLQERLAKVIERAEIQRLRALKHFRVQPHDPLCRDNNSTQTTMVVEDVNCEKCLQMISLLQKDEPQTGLSKMMDLANEILVSAEKSFQLKFYLTEEAVKAGLIPPARAYKDDAGYDLRLLASEPLVIPPHERRPIPTGVGFEIPSGWYGLICNRTSGGKRGLVPLAQVVDASYTGVLTLTLHNTNDSESITLDPGERVAQIVMMPTWFGDLTQIEPGEIKKTDRGAGAYGSSGKF